MSDSSVCNSPSLPSQFSFGPVPPLLPYSLIIFNMRFSVVLATLSAVTFGYAQSLSLSGGDGACIFLATPLSTANVVLLLSATFYTAGLGSCGFQNTDADFIVAVDVATITSFPGAGANPNAYVT